MLANFCVYSKYSEVTCCLGDLHAPVSNMPELNNVRNNFIIITTASNKYTLITRKYLSWRLIPKIFFNTSMIKWFGQRWRERNCVFGFDSVVNFDNHLKNYKRLHSDKCIRRFTGNKFTAMIDVLLKTNFKSTIQFIINLNFFFVFCVTNCILDPPL